MVERVTRTIIVKVPVEGAYGLWADFEKFPQFMQNIVSVTKTSSSMSHWTMAGPLGEKIEWDAETTLLEPNRRIAWNSKDGDGITTSGQVLFTPIGHDQTEVTVTLQYVLPAGPAGKIAAGLFANPEKKLDRDLVNFKAVAEGMPERVKR